MPRYLLGSEARQAAVLSEIGIGPNEFLVCEKRADRGLIFLPETRFCAQTDRTHIVNQEK